MVAERRMPPYMPLATLNPGNVSCTNYDTDELNTSAVSLLINSTSPAKVRLRHWFVHISQYLLVSSIFSSFFTFTSVKGTMENYYQVNVMLVCCLNLVYSIIPAMLIPVIHFFALRYDSTLLAFFCSVINTVGAGIRCTGTDRDGFFLLLLGQTTTAISAAFYPFLQFPLKGCYNQYNCYDHKFLHFLTFTFSILGVSIGNLLPIYIINGKVSTSEIEWYIYKYTLGSVSFSAVVPALLVLVLIQTGSASRQPFYGSTNETLNGLSSTNSTGTTNSSLLIQYIHCFEIKKRQKYIHTFALNFGLFWILLLYFQNVTGAAVADGINYAGWVAFLAILLGIFSVSLMLKIRPKFLKWFSLVFMLLSATCTFVFVLLSELCASQKFYKISFSLLTVSTISILLNLAVSLLQIIEDSSVVSREYFSILSLHLGYIYSSLFGVIGIVLLWKIGGSAFAIFLSVACAVTHVIIVVKAANQGDCIPSQDSMQ